MTARDDLKDRLQMAFRVYALIGTMGPYAVDRLHQVERVGVNAREADDLAQIALDVFDTWEGGAMTSQGLQNTILRMITDATFPTPSIPIMREVLKSEWGHGVPSGHLVNALEEAFDRIDELEAEREQI